MLLGGKRQELFMPELGEFRIRQTGHGGLRSSLSPSSSSMDAAVPSQRIVWGWATSQWLDAFDPETGEIAQGHSWKKAELVVVRPTRRARLRATSEFRPCCRWDCEHPGRDLSRAHQRRRHSLSRVPITQNSPHQTQESRNASGHVQTKYGHGAATGSLTNPPQSLSSGTNHPQGTALKCTWKHLAKCNARGSQHWRSRTPMLSGCKTC